MITINDREYTDFDFMQTYYTVYGDSAGLDDKEEYIQELNDFATNNDITDLEEAMIQHGIDNGYITKD